MYAGTVFRGAVLCTFHEPVSFQVFVRNHRAAVAQPRERQQPRRTAPDAVERALAEHPWLSRADFEEVKQWRPRRPNRAVGDDRSDGGESERSGASEKSGSADDGVDDDDDNDDDQSTDHDVDVDGELAAVRAGLGEDRHDELYSRVVVRGGTWTLESKGAVADRLRGEARPVAQEWCQHFWWPKTNTFSIARYTRDGAEMLAKAYCRRSTFFIRLFF